jgi:hypothetical protein
LWLLYRAARPNEQELAANTKTSAEGADPYESALRTGEVTDALGTFNAERRALSTEPT